MEIFLQMKMSFLHDIPALTLPGDSGIQQHPESG
jgi:hypothetical protein